MKTFFTADEPVVPGHHPRVLVDTAVAQGADSRGILDGLGISYDGLVDPDCRVSYAQYVKIAERAIALTGNPAIGIDFGKQAHVAHWGVLGLAAMNAATAGEALRMSLQYYRTFAPGWDLSVRVEGAVGHFVARETISRGAFLTFATEALLATMWRLATDVLRKPLPVRELRLGYPRPAHAHRYSEFTLGTVVFDCDATEALFDAAVLDEPIVGASPAMAVVAERYCAEEAARVVVTDGLLAQVRKAIDGHPEPRPRIDAIARELRTSGRSLRRGLRQMGSTYQALLDASTRVRAEAELRRSGSKIEAIALQIGFADVRSFRRAFKRWTGVSPREFRRRTRR